jgi:hypothetical protein
MYSLIEAEKADRRNVKRAHELLKVAGARLLLVYLAQPPQYEEQDPGLAKQIRASDAESRGRYGAPQVHGAGTTGDEAWAGSFSAVTG